MNTENENAIQHEKQQTIAINGEAINDLFNFS